MAGSEDARQFPGSSLQIFILLIRSLRASVSQPVRIQGDAGQLRDASRGARGGERGPGDPMRPHDLPVAGPRSPGAPARRRAPGGRLIAQARRVGRGGRGILRGGSQRAGRRAGRVEAELGFRAAGGRARPALLRLPARSPRSSRRRAARGPQRGDLGLHGAGLSGRRPPRAAAAARPPARLGRRGAWRGPRRRGRAARAAGRLARARRGAEKRARRPASMEEKYLPELMAEKDSLDPSFTHALRLVNREIEKFQKGEGKDEEKYIDVVINKNMKLGQKVLIPVKQFPKFNFVGKLLGPRGNSLKRLQEETLTKMSILGKGSMRDKAKEEELRKSGEAKYFHLNDDLHVLIEVFAPPAEAYARMGHALEEIKKFLIPDYNDEIRQAQLQELTYLNGGSDNADVPVVRGKSTLRTRGVTTPAITRGRGGVTARPVAVGVPRGTPTPRGVLSTRGPVSRGRGLLTPRARGVPPTGYRPPPPPPTQETYGEYDYDDGYGTAYDEQSYDSYDNSYSTPAQSGADYYDYGHGLSEEAYDSYGQEEWTNSRHKAPSARTAKGVYRDQPYGRY